MVPICTSPQRSHLKPQPTTVNHIFTPSGARNDSNLFFAVHTHSTPEARELVARYPGPLLPQSVVICGGASGRRISSSHQVPAQTSVGNDDGTQLRELRVGKLVRDTASQSVIGWQATASRWTFPSHQFLSRPGAFGGVAGVTTDGKWGEVDLEKCNHHHHPS